MTENSSFAQSSNIDGTSYLLDSNVLLFVCFVKDSFVSEMIRALIRLGGEVVITQRVIEEASAVVAQLTSKDDSSFYLAFSKSTENFNWLIVDDSDFAQESEDYFGTDCHIYSAALLLNAEVITNDLELIFKLRTYGLSARSAFSQQRRIIEFEGGNSDVLEYIAKIFRFSATKGAVYTRARPGGWLGRVTGEKYTLFDFVGFGWCYYDSRKKVWMFKTDSAEELSIPWETVDSDVFVSISFKSVSATQISCTFRVAESGKATGNQNSTLEIGTKNIGQGQVSIGHTRNQSSHWNGTVYIHLVSPNSLPAKAWKKLLLLRDEAPDPTSSDILEFAIAQSFWSFNEGELETCNFDDVLRYLSAKRFSTE